MKYWYIEVRITDKKHYYTIKFVIIEKKNITKEDLIEKYNKEIYPGDKRYHYTVVKEISRIDYMVLSRYL